MNNLKISPLALGLTLGCGWGLAVLIIGPKDFPIILKKIGSWIGSIKKYFSELQSEVTLYEHESDEEKNLNKNKARDMKDEK